MTRASVLLLFSGRKLLFIQVFISSRQVVRDDRAAKGFGAVLI